MAEAPPAIGIDLGTTYSVVSVFRKRKVEIIQNDAGSRTTPSYVAFTDDKEYVGQAAKELATSNTLFDSKRLLGRRFDDAELEKDLENWPFTVKNDGGVPKYEITLDGIPRMISPEEISSKILKAMKITAEESFGHECEVMKAVVTVPAYFNDSQRQATMTAGRLAGLEVIAILNEPTAAAMAFGFGAKKNSTTLIFDLGGGTFDVTVLKIRGDNFDTLAHGGDTHLGGQDFDNILLTHVLDDIEKKEGVRINRDDDIEVFHEIRAQCELVKRRLSTLPQATINVFLSRHGKGYRREISRAFFEDLCTPFFKRAIDILPGVLKDAGVTKEQIDEVVLVGGSTRIPKVRSMLQQFFDGKELNKSINPDEAVAQGAAIYAASLTGVAGAKQVRMKDVSSLSLGVAQSTGLMAVLIPRNSALPCSVTKPFTTASDQQEEAEIKICQGERARWQDNDILGDFTLSVPARPKGEVDIDTTFSLDENGVLTVTAVEVSSGEKASVTVQSESRLTERELQQLLAQAQRFRLEDEESRDRARRERFQV